MNSKNYNFLTCPENVIKIFYCKNTENKLQTTNIFDWFLSLKNVQNKLKIILSFHIDE